MSSIEDRVEALEIGLRRWRTTTITLACGIVAIVAIAAAPEGEVRDILRTRKLEVVNQENKVVVSVESTRDGGVMRVLGREHPYFVQIQAAHVATPDPSKDVAFGAVTINGPDGGAFASLVASKDGAVIFGRKRADGEPTFVVRDKVTQEGSEIVWSAP